MKLDGKTQLTQTGVHGTNLIVPYVKNMFSSGKMLMKEL
jgi:hypothetical protein